MQQSDRDAGWVEVNLMFGLGFVEEDNSLATILLVSTKCNELEWRKH